jgi:hypothetical protein
MLQVKGEAVAFILSPTVLGICAYLDSVTDRRSVWPILADALEECGYPEELCTRFRRFRRPYRSIYPPKWTVETYPGGRRTFSTLDPSIFRRLRRGKLFHSAARKRANIKVYQELSTLLVDLANAHAACNR